MQWNLVSISLLQSLLLPDPVLSPAESAEKSRGEGGVDEACGEEMGRVSASTAQSIGAGGRTTGSVCTAATDTERGGEDGGVTRLLRGRLQLRTKLPANVITPHPLLLHLICYSGSR
ncbi:hypothetical protein B0H13DRAFT_2302480 [Mycena leptocephala]|nr:hypothetical protein B0H13DRAFT_2302480 [Mycena leptocephala]